MSESPARECWINVYERPGGHKHLGAHHGSRGRLKWVHSTLPQARLVYRLHVRMKPAHRAGSEGSTP